MAPKKLVIATRASRLALWQAEHVQARLQALYPACRVDILAMSTRGDQILDQTLSKIGGKGLFIKALETALLEGRADLAVHSLKDVPADLDVGFALPAILARAEPRDALVSNTYARLEDLPAGARVGTSSLRREAQLRAHFPHLNICPLRGNLDTRLRKLDAGEYAAIILAAAGLCRLGLQTRIRQVLPLELSLPAAGQGALALETLAARADVQDWLLPLACPHSTACCTAERTVSRVLGGACHMPLAAYAQVQEQALDLRALLAAPDGTCIMRAQRRDSVQNAQDVGQAVAQDLLDAGAADLLASLVSAAGTAV